MKIYIYDTVRSVDSVVLDILMGNPVLLFLRNSIILEAVVQNTGFKIPRVRIFFGIRTTVVFSDSFFTLNFNFVQKKMVLQGLYFKGIHYNLILNFNFGLPRNN